MTQDRHLDDGADLLEQLGKEASASTPRGFITGAVGILDTALRQLLMAHFVESAESAKLFGKGGELRSTDAKRRVAFACGLISQKEADVLNTVFNMALAAGEFAEFDYATGKTASFVLSLRRSVDYMSGDDAAAVTAAVLWVAGRLFDRVQFENHRAEAR